MDWHEVIERIQKIAQVLAVCIGGIWVYFNTLRGRVYVPRLELDLSGTRLQEGRAQYLLITMQFKNVGASLVEIEKKNTALRVTPVRTGKAESDPEISIGDQERLYRERKTLPILRRYTVVKSRPAKGESRSGKASKAPDIRERPLEIIEAGTSIHEQKLIVIPQNVDCAYELELIVSVHRRQKRWIPPLHKEDRIRYRLGKRSWLPPWRKPYKVWNALAMVPPSKGRESRPTLPAFE